MAVSAPPAAAPARLVGAQRTPVSQLELAAATVDVEEGESLATVTVRRKGNLHGQVGFTWWTESGTAKPATDFAPAMPHAEYIEDGKASASLNIRLTDTRRAQARSFYVVIDKPEGDATLGARTLTMITLPANQPDKANQSGK